MAGSRRTLRQRVCSLHLWTCAPPPRPSPGCVCMSACVSCWWDSNPSIPPSSEPPRWTLTTRIFCFGFLAFFFASSKTPSSTRPGRRTSVSNKASGSLLCRTRHVHAKGPRPLTVALTALRVHLSYSSCAVQVGFFVFFFFLSTWASLFYSKALFS